MPTQSSTTVASRLIAAASVAVLSLSARAADITWEDKTGDWTQDELWDGGVAPGPEDTASFKSGEMTITNAVEFGQEFHIGRGNGGTGVLSIEATGSVTGGCYHVGRDGGNGTMIVDGGFVKATLSDWYGSFNVGWGGNSVGIVQLKSGTIEPNHVAIGRSATATGRLEISGGEFKAESNADFNIGHDDGNDNGIARGEVVITGGKLLASGGGNLNVAAGKSSIGEMTLEGGVVENSKGLRIGGASNAVGRVTVTGGAWTNTENSVNIGATTDGIGYLMVDGGEFYSGKHLRVGNKGIGRLTIGGAGVVIDGTSGDDYMCFGGPDSVIRLNVGGKLYLRSILREDENGTVEFNGGEMIKTVENGAYSWVGLGSTAIDENHTINILAGGMIFNSDFTSTIKGSILCPEGCGGITKRGSGELNLNTNNGRSFEFSGPIYVEGGTLRFSGNAQVPEFVDVIRVAEGATLVIPHDVTCRVLENNGTIQGGTVTVESDAATKVATKAVWTGAMGDGNVLNAKNYIVYDQNDRVMYEQTITVDLPVIVPYHLGMVVPSFVGFTDVSWVVEEDICSEGYSRPAVLGAAVAWYDPSDASTLKKDAAGRVEEIANKGTLGSVLDLQKGDSGATSSALSADGFNGRQAIAFAGSTGYRSKQTLPSDVPANGPRALFVVAKGDTGKMTMLSIAQTGAEEGRCWLLAHGSDWGRSYQVSYKDSDEDDWKSWKVGFGNGLVNQKAYVFSGKTELKDGVLNGRVVTSAALDGEGNKLGTTDDSHLMPDGEGNLNLYTYYGLFQNGGYLAHSDGYQGEALIFTNALSDAEMDAVNAYLKAKWLDAMQVMPDFDNLVVNAQVDLGGATRTFEKLSGSGSFADGTVVVTGDLVVTVKADGTVVAPSFDKLVLGPSARLVVNGAKNLPTGNAIDIISFASLDGAFAAAVGDKNRRVLPSYFEDHVSARRGTGLSVVLR